MWDLVLRGMRPFFPTSDEEIKTRVRQIDKSGGFLGAKESGNLVAFALIAWPDNSLETPQVLHFYSEGSKKTTKLLVGYVLDTVKNRGYNKLRAINGSGADDEIWTRAFRHEGWEIKPVKTVFEFEAVK